MQCRITASLRATATVVFLRPMRLTSLVAQGFQRRWTTNHIEEHIGSLEKIGAREPIASFGDAAIPIQLA
jgi:hypothetical protein